MVRQQLIAAFLITTAVLLIAAWFYPPLLWCLAVIGPVAAVGVYDSLQRQHTILRNFPIIGHFRYWMERFRPEIQQYFIDSNIDAYPIEREFRSLVYQRAKGELETQPFGTQRDVYRVGYEWAPHSLAAHHYEDRDFRVGVGGERCTQPYESSLLNVSAMSYGAISDRAVLALSQGAKRGGFAQNTGEGGIAPEHVEGGGDLIWQIGTGYFGCRTRDGAFDGDAFERQAQHPSVKMIELKLSQGAKPGHGGVLPGIKVTRKIAEIRHVEPGRTVISPASHPAFDSPVGLLEFVDRLRKRSGGKPTGFKLCVGRRTDFFAICKAMLDTGIKPDFITVDGGEGGTGAAPLEFSNSIGMPGRDAWVFAHNALQGAGLRDRIKLVASGRIISAFHMVRAIALGADLCATARGMMFALGCIQSLRCNANTCPTGIATQNPALIYGLDVNDKAARVARFHAAMVHGFFELLGAMGLSSPDDLRPEHIFRRVDDLHVRNMRELYEYLEPGQLLDDRYLPEGMSDEWSQARSDRWSLSVEHGQYGGARMRG